MTEERDPRISRRYRSLGSEEPSRELDQAILSAAHRAADRAHAPLVTPAGRHRWYFAFGAAAILVLAVAVTVQVERQQPDAESLPASPPAALADRTEGFLKGEKQARDGERVELRKEAEQRRPLSDSGAPARQMRRERAQEPAAAASPPTEVKPKLSVEAQATPTPAPAAAPAPEADRRARADIQLREVQQRAEPQAAPAPRASILQDRVAASAAAESPEAVLERIAVLRKEGRHEEADKALAEFRQRYPDYRISDEMLQKVERKK
jgi:hypothetical protein